jgi:K+-sensing histidine kinase KdpD
MPDEKLHADAEPQVSMPNVVRFVRQLSHDLRNSLNAAELQAAYVSEIANDAEVKTELKRLREMVSELGGALQKLTASLGDVRMMAMEYGAADFVEDTRQKFTTQFPDAANAVDWKIDVNGDTMLNIDPQLLQIAMHELFDNALRHSRGEGAITVKAAVADGEFALELREPKAAFDHSIENWGREPLQSVAHGHYGLGLHRVRRILDAHGGRMDARYDTDAASLITTVRLPLASR